MLSESVSPLSVSVFSFLEQREIDLATVSLDLGDSGALVLALSETESYPLTPRGFESLCRVIQVPVGFGKKLRDDGASHVLSYLQRQLAQTYVREPVIIVLDKSTIRDTADHILAVTTKDMILPSNEAISEMDHEILKTAQNYAKTELVSRVEVDGTLRYTFVAKQARLSVDTSEYRFGHVYAYSLYGLEAPQIYQVAVRCEDMSTMTLPLKPAEYSTRNATFLGDLLSAIEALDTAGWTDLDIFLTRLNGVKASLYEIKETRQKMLKMLKVDQEDLETNERIENFFGWKKLQARYEIKTMSQKPSKKWYMSAASDLKLLDVYLKLIAETTHAPNTLPVESRIKLEKYATKMLGRMPDLAEKEPPKIEF